MNAYNVSANPRWAETLFAENCAAIEDIAIARGFPMPSTVSGGMPLFHGLGGCDISGELGEGHYGVVYPTTDPKVVLKITSDETEAHFIKISQHLATQGIQASGIVRYFDVFALKGQRRGRDVFVLWREAAYDIGKLDQHFCDQGEYFCRQAEIFKKYIWQWVDTGRLLRKMYLSKENSPDRWQWLDKQVSSMDEVYQQEEDLFDVLSHLHNYAIIVHSINARFKRNPLRFAALLVALERIAQGMSNENVAYQVGRTLGEYLNAGLVLADVHTGNLGFVGSRDDDPDFADTMPVITDPGHVMILKEELSRVPVEVL